MTITFGQLWVFTAAMVLLVISPGPVVSAIISRVLGRGYHAIWPIVLAVMVGDFLWVALVLFGLGGFVRDHTELMLVVRYIGAAYLIYLGVQEIRHASAPIGEADLGNKKQFWPVFVAGLGLILANPKAIFFYGSFLPRFFDIASVTWIDALIIALTASTTALIGNLIWGAFAHGAAQLISSVKGRSLLRKISGATLILVAIVMVLMK